MPQSHRAPRDTLIPEPSRPPLIGLAHGSRHPRVTQAIAKLLAVVSEDAGIETRAAYLDLVEPDLAAVAAELAAAGHRSAVVVPLLFTSAFHATVDVPEALAAAESSSGLQLELAEVLGTGSDIEAVLRQSLDEFGAADADVLLFAVGSSSPAANTAVHDLADRLGATRSGRVRAGFGTADPRASAVLRDLERSSGSSRPLVVLPLFLAPGLLLDPLRTQAADRGWSIAPPLAERAAPAVARRYQDRADHVRLLR